MARKMKLNVNQNVLSKIAGYESVNSADTSVATKGATGRLLSPWSNATKMEIYNLIKKQMPEEHRYIHFASESVNFYNQKLTENNAVTAAVTDIVQNPKKFEFLPKQIQASLEHVKDAIVEQRTKMRNAKKNTVEYESARHLTAQASTALGNALFNIFARVHTEAPRMNFQNTTGFGFESSAMDYLNSVYFPQLEANVQWLNVPGVVYSKIVPIKNVIDKYSAIPILTRRYVWMEKDAEGRYTGEKLERDELYNRMIPEAGVKTPMTDMMNTREFTIVQADYGKEFDLQKPGALSNMPGKSIIEPKESIRAEFQIIKHKRNGQDYGEIIDNSIDNVFVQEASYTEMDETGKIIKFIPDLSDKTKFYSISVRYYYKEGPRIMFFSVIKSDTSMDNIDEMTIRLKMVDVNHINFTRWEMRIFDERRYLETPEETKSIPISINSEQFKVTNDRAGIDFQQMIMTETAAMYAHAKEACWLDGYRTMRDRVATLEKADRAAGVKGPRHLYVNKTINFQYENTVNKLENIGILLFKAFEYMRVSFKQRSNTQTLPQMNMLTSTLSLPLIKKDTTAVTGEVTETSNGEFLGVQAVDATRIMTVGDEQDTIHSIVVSTDKVDAIPLVQDPITKAELPAAEQEHYFDIVPIFRESNLATSFMVEAPIQMISDPAYNYVDNLGLPAVFYKTAYKFVSFRDAAGKLTIKGDAVSAY